MENNQLTKSDRIEHEAQLEVIAPSALESIERANVDMQISTARRYPRSLTIVKRRMMDLATLDEETAESCFYKLNRQGKQIEGPSIRLAEIAASSFGNLRYGARVIANDGKTITAQGFCHDLETNVLATIETRRRITNRDGQTYSEDMQVVTGNAACAIAARNSIFKVVPFAFVKPIFEAAKRTAVGDLTTLAERRTKMLSRFAAMGVDQRRIVASLGKNGIEEIGLAELETLIGVHNAIRDNDQTIDEAFPAPVTAGPIKFGEPIEPNASDGKTYTPGTILPPGVEPIEQKPKRHRRTKAEIEAERAATNLSGGEAIGRQSEPASSNLVERNHVPAEGVGSEAVEGNSKPSSQLTSEAERPPAAENAGTVTETNEPPTLLQQLRVKLLHSGITEAQFKRYLIVNGHVDPSDRFEKMTDEKLQDIVNSYESLLEDVKASIVS